MAGKNRKRAILLCEAIDVVQPLVVELQDKGLDVTVRRDLPDADVVSDGDAVVLVDTAGFAVRARQWLQQLGRHPEAKGHTVLVATEQGHELRLLSLKSGVNSFFSWPAEWLSVAGNILGALKTSQEGYHRALVVDDDPVAAALFAQWLESAGLDVTLVHEPEQVLMAVQRTVPDVIVLDLYMPRISGLDIARMIRQDASFASLPIIFVSVEQRMQKQLFVLDHGIDCFLSKPVDEATLVTLTLSRAKKYRELVGYERELQVALRELDDQYYALNKHAIVSITDSSGTILSVNDRFCAISGFSRDELLGNNHRLVKSGQHSSAFYRDLWLTISAGRIWRGEVCNRRKDGEIYWVEATIVPLVDSMGIPYRYISIRTEITRIKEAEAQLRVSEERYKRSQSFANIGTWDWDIQTGELFWSDRIAPLFGYEPGVLETSYENFIQSVHEDDRQLVVDAINACIERGEKYEIEHRCVWPDGSVRWLLERGDVVRDRMGRPAHMLGAVQDITARKIAEDSRREAQKMLRMVLDYIPVAVYWKDRHGRYIGANSPFSRLLGSHDWADLIGRTDSELGWPGNQGEIFHRRDLQRMQLKDACTESEIEIVDCGQIKHHFVFNQVLMYDQDGEPVGMLGALLSINDRVDYEKQLLKAKEQAEQASRAKSDFLSGMSHELRTPLNSIIGFAQLMQMHMDSSDPERVHVEEIETSGQHLLALINNVLDMAKIEAGKIDIHITSIDVKEIVDDSIMLSRYLQDQYGIEVQTAIDAGINVNADQTRLRQVLINLISNAIKYNRPGGRVEVFAEQHDELVTISVKDTGIGIPRDKVEQVFQPFSRLGAENGTIEGAGIGMVITRDLVELMGGKLYLVSEEGVGTEAGFSLRSAETSGSRNEL